MAHLKKSLPALITSVTLTSPLFSRPPIPNDLLPPRSQPPRATTERPHEQLYTLLQTLPGKHHDTPIPGKEGFFYRVRAKETDTRQPYLLVSIMQEPHIRLYDFYDGRNEVNPQVKLDGVVDQVDVWDLGAEPIAKRNSERVTDTLSREYNSIISYCLKSLSSTNS